MACLSLIFFFSFHIKKRKDRRKRINFDGTPIFIFKLYPLPRMQRKYNKIILFVLL